MKDITIIGVEGRNDISAINQALKAIQFSTQGFDVSRKILFCNVEPTFPSVDVEVVHIEPITNIEEYNFFMLHLLPDFIKTEYVLVVQSDGFILRPEKWTDEFLEYDYIGAPWPLSWPQSETNRVGNGGFSLRSKKLLQVASNIFGVNEPEDGLICLNYKPFMDAMGIKFAPAELAARFSWEHDTEFDHKTSSFGFHGKHTLLHLQYIANLQ